MSSKLRFCIFSENIKINDILFPKFYFNKKFSEKFTFLIIISSFSYKFQNIFDINSIIGRS